MSPAVPGPGPASGAATGADAVPAALERLEVRAAIAPLHAEARVSSPQVSQRLAGHVVEVLAHEGDWRRVRGDDGYEGWAHRGYLRPATAAARPRPLSLGCVVRRVDGSRAALPLGARLEPGDVVESGDACDPADLARRFPPDPAAIAATAAGRFAGTPYQWGGITPWGADCSGLVQTTFGLHGIALPRDAWQQAASGDAAPSALDALHPADLLFFSDRPDGRITHVGIALGAMRMVHLGLGRGGHAVERLDADDPYVRALVRRYVGARRVELTGHG